MTTTVDPSQADRWVATPPPPSAVLSAATAAVSDLDDVLWAVKSPAELLRSVRSVAALRSALDAVELHLVAEIDATETGRSEGYGDLTGEPGCHAARVRVAADVLVALVALLHAYFLVLEMVLWTKPLGRRTFGLDRAFAEQTRSLAANQGLYNGFLAAGLVWGLLAGGDLRVPVLTFFLLCVVVAGLFGAATVSRRILLVQAVPAVLALAAVRLAA